MSLRSELVRLALRLLVSYLGDDPDAITVQDPFGGRHRYPG